MALTQEESKIYMSLSSDPNERGRLWKEYKIKHGYHDKRVKEMMEYYDQCFLKRAQQILKTL